jgi:copper transport protein
LKAVAKAASRLVSGGALCFAFLTLFASKAEAHASLVSSSPASGSRLAVSPREIRLVFSEDVVAELSHVDLVRGDGTEQTLSVTSDPRDVHALISPVESLEPGAYRIVWHIISADGHPVSESFVFQVGDGTFRAPPEQVMSHGEEVAVFAGEPMLAGAALIPAILRGLALCALLTLAGLLAFDTHLSRSGVVPSQMLSSWLSVSATVLLTLHLLAWLKHISPEQSIDSDFISAALTRSVGATEALRLGFAVLATWALVLARRPFIALLFTLAAVLVGGAIGHPAAIHPLIAIPAKSLHLLAVALWLGGLVWLAASFKYERSVAAASTVSAVALIAISVVAVTGILQSFLFLNHLSDLTGSAYGLTILAKTAGLLVLLSFGAYHRYRVMPLLDTQAGQTSMKRSLRLEIVVMLAVTMLGGFLAYVPTPHMMADMPNMNSHTNPK